MRQKLPITTERCNLETEPYALITVREQGLLNVQISVDAGCRVRRATRPAPGGIIVGIEVTFGDGAEYFFRLAYQRWLVERPELDRAVERVFAAVLAAIEAEQAGALVAA